MKKQSTMRPQDVVILLKMISLGKGPWLKIELADALGISPAEVTFALERCRRAGLVDEAKHTVNTTALAEFLRYGLRYTFPAETGAPMQGIATAVSAPVMRNALPKPEETYVWATREGTETGVSVKPLYAKVPHAALRDAKLYHMLALTDCLRLGTEHERTVASEILKALFKRYDSRVD